MALKLAVDISNYSGAITAEQAECWRQNGVRKVIVGLQSPSLAAQQMAVIVDAGLELEAYWYFSFSRSPIAQAETAWDRCNGWPVKRLWLDFEDDPGDMVPSAVADWIVLAASVARSRGPVGIYSAAWWWVPYTGNTDRLRDLPLWVAHYDYESDIDPVAFGGWTKASMEQYSGTTELCGVSVDLDVYEEEDMVDQTTLDKLAELRALADALDDGVRRGQSPMLSVLQIIRLSGLAGEVAVRLGAALKP